MFSLIIASLLAAGPAEFRVETLDGETFTGRLQRWTAEQIVLETDEGPQPIAAQAWLAVEPAVADDQPFPADAEIRVTLIDGSRIATGQLLVADGQASLERGGDRQWTLPAKQIASVQLGPLEDAELKRQWQDIVRKEHRGDVIVIRKKSALDYIDGVLGRVTAEKVHFLLDGDEIPVDRARVAGMVYFQSDPASLPAAACIVHTRGGSQLQAKSATWSQGKLQVAGPGGWQLDVPLAELRRVDYAAGKLRYLSELEIELLSSRPYFGLPKPIAAEQQWRNVAVDRSLEGGRLRLPATDDSREVLEFSRGIALRSESEIECEVPDGFRRFRALAGIDHRVRPLGHVELTIWGDEQRLLEAALGGTDAPLPIDLDVSRFRRLRIGVDYGRGGDVADHLDLCRARFTK